MLSTMEIRFRTGMRTVAIGGSHGNRCDGSLPRLIPYAAVAVGPGNATNIASVL